jgi:biopolymer transport protein ExbD
MKSSRRSKRVLQRFPVACSGARSVWSAASPRRFSFHTTQSGEDSPHSKRSASTRCILIPKGSSMKRDLAVLALILLTTISAMGQGKKKPPPSPLPPPLEDPMKSPHRLLVSILPGGKITLNDNDVTDLKQLGEILRKTLEEREISQPRAVIFQAPPEMKYGELMAVLDVIDNSGGVPIIPYIGNLSVVVNISLVGAPNQFGGPSVSLPSVLSWASEAGYQKNLAIVTISKTGIYMIRGVKISSGDEGYELALESQIGLAMKKLGLEDPQVLYVNCDKDAFYSDIQLLIKAARAHTNQIAFWIKVKPRWIPMGVYRSPRRGNHRK